MMTRENYDKAERIISSIGVTKRIIHSKERAIVQVKCNGYYKTLQITDQVSLKFNDENKSTILDMLERELKKSKQYLSELELGLANL